MTESKSTTKRRAAQKPAEPTVATRPTVSVNIVPEPEVIPSVARVREPEVIKKKRVPEGAPKWHGSDVLALRDKLGLEILPALVPTEAYDTRRWAVDSMTCTEVVLLGEMLTDYASRLASE